MDNISKNRNKKEDPAPEPPVETVEDAPSKDLMDQIFDQGFREGYSEACYYMVTGLLLVFVGYLLVRLVDHE